VYVYVYVYVVAMTVVVAHIIYASSSVRAPTHARIANNVGRVAL
jgi:hypothetical protein